MLGLQQWYLNTQYFCEYKHSDMTVQVRFYRYTCYRKSYFLELLEFETT